VAVASHIFGQMVGACAMIMKWNENVRRADDYLTSPEGMQIMAASCMLIESIGEGVKKVDRLLPGFLDEKAPDVPWRSIKGLRDHIAHGYFNIDAEIVLDVAANEIPHLKEVFTALQSELQR